MTLQRGQGSAGVLKLRIVGEEAGKICHLVGLMAGKNHEPMILANQPLLKELTLCHAHPG
jgi:hypothetical protein